mmetsp:Transcript_17360/g.37703  ORF Transcript_17360/g.37703 Transcript_17360/m.37703 type:complete len:123 (+) Transcript_17360:65-433(+)|eukprot:CAMPEP_0185849180 /NCGR_PEP_ID=MMETSP1354-20130828/3771_1 /TAXON_ID=708628 /ORGANISM="Erythrolobus madagascarensis, Strain CCMP3276" /LENGTH=122 /DNA_ID=CAMNT_0028549663 /DNA_START=42 /DNA_END=410 /DNA_ORIENTATION=-
MAKGKKVQRSQSAVNFARSTSLKNFGTENSATTATVREYDQQLDFVFSSKPPKTSMRDKVDRSLSRKGSSRYVTLNRNATADPASLELSKGEFVSRDVFGRNEKTLPGPAPEFEVINDQSSL